MKCLSGIGITSSPLARLYRVELTSLVFFKSLVRRNLFFYSWSEIKAQHRSIRSEQKATAEKAKLRKLQYRNGFQHGNMELLGFCSFIKLVPFLMNGITRSASASATVVLELGSEISVQSYSSYIAYLFTKKKDCKKFLATPRWL